MINKKLFLILLKKYRKGGASEKEIALLNAYYALFEVEPDLVGNLLPEERQALEVEMENQVFHRIALLERRKSRKGSYAWWALAAASVIILLSFSLSLFLQDKELKDKNSTLVEVLPGGNKAVLTLADGSKIALDDARNGHLADQGNISISKTADGQVIYQASPGLPGQREMSFNTIETPTGGQFQVILPDGSKVWLNSRSSIRYPTAFLGNERRVEITGEAYFEIEKDERKPFRVVANHQLTEVLGTHFNINAYTDERSVNTTLLEGSVKVFTLTGKKSVILSPFQQSQLFVGNGFKILTEVDIEEAVAWKNGNFQFNGADLGAVMRQLSRWYDVEIDIPDMPKKEFNGIIPRSVKLSKVLKMLELTSKLKFKVQEKPENPGRRMIMLR